MEGCLGVPAVCLPRGSVRIASEVSRDRERRKLPIVGTVRGRTLLASLMLLFLLGSVIAVAVVRANQDRSQHQALELRTATVADIEETRAQFYLAGTMIMSAALADDPTPYIEPYRAAVKRREIPGQGQSWTDG